MNHAIFPTFQLHLFLIHSLDQNQITWEFHHQLRGLKQCLQRGENRDVVPDPTEHQHEKYYEWYFWREFSQLITEKHPDAVRCPIVSCSRNAYVYSRDSSIFEVSSHHLLDAIWILHISLTHSCLQAVWRQVSRDIQGQFDTVGTHARRVTPNAPATDAHITSEPTEYH